MVTDFAKLLNPGCDGYLAPGAVSIEDCSLETITGWEHKDNETHSDSSSDSSDSSDDTIIPPPSARSMNSVPPQVTYRWGHLVALHPDLEEARCYLLDQHYNATHDSPVISFTDYLAAHAWFPAQDMLQYRDFEEFKPWDGKWDLEGEFASFCDNAMESPEMEEFGIYIQEQAARWESNQRVVTAFTYFGFGVSIEPEQLTIPDISDNDDDDVRPLRLALGTKAYISFQKGLLDIERSWFEFDRDELVARLDSHELTDEEFWAEGGQVIVLGEELEQKEKQLLEIESELDLQIEASMMEV